MTAARHGQVVHGMVHAYEELHRGFLAVLLRKHPGDPEGCERVASVLARAHAESMASGEIGREIIGKAGE